MAVQILTYCDTMEVNSITSNTLFELQKKDWSTDSFLSSIIGRLIPENQLLIESLDRVKGSSFTQKLMDADSVFDRDFICTKQFLYANRHSKDPKIAENAESTWKIFSAHNINLHKLSYEKQMSSTDALLSDLDAVKVKPIIDTLTGVPESILALRSSAENLKAIFRNRVEDKASQEDIIAPSIQKNLIRDILNTDLLPYLEMMAKVQPEIYGATSKVILEYVEAVNIKARTRRTRNSNQVEEPVVPEEN